MKRLIVACVLVAGCSSDQFFTTTSSRGTPTTVETTREVDPTARIANQFDIGAICASVAAHRGTATAQSDMAVLSERAEFTALEMTYIANGQVAVGMSERAGICALGGNDIKIDSVRTVTTSNHVIKTFRFEGTANQTLITDNGVVTGFNQGS